MRWLKRLAGVAALLYLGVAAMLFFMQRSLLYVPDRTHASAAAAGIPGMTELRLKTSDGEEIAAWRLPPRDGEPVLLYLHGNGGNLAGRARRFRELTAQGAGLLAIDWRGYGGSTGAPSQEGILRDADAAWAEALKMAGSPRHIVIIGESLGSAPAIALAAREAPAGLVIDSGFSSVADVAADRYWMFPVGLLLRDPFRSDELIGKVRAPILALHGDADRIVPIRFGEKIFALAPEPKEFVRIAGAGHLVLGLPVGMERFRAWLARL